MNVLKFLISKRFLIHIALAIGVVFLLLMVTFTSLSIYTNHRESKETPDFTGLTESQFINIVHANGLRYKIIDSLHINDKVPGAVIEQTPKPGSLIKEHRTIFFTINAFTVEQLPIPKLTDISLRNAIAILDSRGLKLGKLTYVPSEYDELVLEQDYKGNPISPGTMVNKGAIIDLSIGQRLDKKTNIPNLISLSLDEATEQCRALMLNIGSAIFDNSVVNEEDSMKAIIWRQSPAVDTLIDKKIRLGSSLDIWLTADSMKMDSIKANTIRLDTTKVDSVKEEALLIN